MGACPWPLRGGRPSEGAETAPNPGGGGGRYPPARGWGPGNAGGLAPANSEDGGGYRPGGVGVGYPAAAVRPIRILSVSVIS